MFTVVFYGNAFSQAFLTPVFLVLSLCFVLFYSRMWIFVCVRCFFPFIVPIFSIDEYHVQREWLNIC